MNVWFIPQGLLTAAFLRAVLTGVLSGAVYDLSRAPRRAFGIRRVISALLDAGFVLVLLGLVFCFFVVEAYGVPRGWFACGIALGAALYFALLSPLVLLIFVAALTIIQKIFVFLLKNWMKLMSFLGKGVRRLAYTEKIRKKSKFLFHFRTK